LRSKFRRSLFSRNGHLRVDFPQRGEKLEQAHLDVPQLFGIPADERPLRIKVGMRFSFFMSVVPFLFLRRAVPGSVFMRAGRGKQFVAYDLRFQGDFLQTATGFGREGKQLPGIMQDGCRIPNGLFLHFRFRSMFKSREVGKGDFEVDFDFLPLHGQIQVRRAVFVGFVRECGRREQHGAGKDPD
jgi:hypothetical protein